MQKFLQKHARQRPVHAKLPMVQLVSGVLSVLEDLKESSVT